MFTPADYRFIADTLGTTPEHRARLVVEVRGDPDRLERLLEDDRLTRRLLAEEEQIARISPRLLFALLLRQVGRDLRRQQYTVERLDAAGPVPVFDARAAWEALSDRALREYLVDMLASFVRAEHVTLLSTRAGRVERRRLSTLDIDDMITLAGLVEEGDRFPLYKRIADIALSVAGLFGDYMHRARSAGGSSMRGTIDARRIRALEDYEEHGRRFYRLAASHATARTLRLDRVLDRLAEDFALVRKPLSVMADRYLTWTWLRRLDWLSSP